MLARAIRELIWLRDRSDFIYYSCRCGDWFRMARLVMTIFWPRCMKFLLLYRLTEFSLFYEVWNAFCWLRPSLGEGNCSWILNWDGLFAPWMKFIMPLLLSDGISFNWWLTKWDGLTYWSWERYRAMFFCRRSWGDEPLPTSKLACPTWLPWDTKSIPRLSYAVLRWLFWYGWKDDSEFYLISKFEELTG